VSGPEERLAALGLTLPEVAAPLAAYQPAVRDGSYVWTSGQLPTIAGKLLATGKVGGTVTPEQGGRVCPAVRAQRARGDQGAGR